MWISRRKLIRTGCAAGIVSLAPHFLDRAQAGLHFHGTSIATAIPQSVNLVTRFSADSLALSNNANVTSWTDGINSIVAGTTVGIAPIFKTNRLGGKPSVQCSGGGLSIASPGVLKTALDSSLYTVLIVFRTLGSVTNGMLFGASNNAGNGIFYLADGISAGRFGFAAPYAGQTNFSVLGNSASNLYGAVGPATYEFVSINGTSVGINQNGNPTTASNTIAIGTNAGNDFPVNAEIFDILVWSVALSQTEILQAQMWACDKYSQPYPWAALSAFTIFDGDSLTVGTNSSGLAATYPYVAAQSLGLTYGQWSNVAVGGIAMQNMGVFAPVKIDGVSALINKNVRLSVFEWFNQRGPSPTPFNNSASYLAARKAASARTYIAFGDSTDNTQVGDEPNRAAYNTAVASITNADQKVAISANANIGVSGSAANGTYFGGDGVHMTDAGYSVLAGLMATGIAALP